MGEDGERAGGIKADTSNGCGIDVVLGQGLLDGGTDALPDISSRLFLHLTSVGGLCKRLSRLYIVTLLWLPQPDILRGQANYVTLRIDDASSSTAGTDVDAYVVIHMDIEFIVRIR